MRTKLHLPWSPLPISIMANHDEQASSKPLLQLENTQTNHCHFDDMAHHINSSIIQQTVETTAFCHKNNVGTAILATRERKEKEKLWWCAGTSGLPVTEEATMTLEATAGAGIEVWRGSGRMDGALPSVVAGLVSVHVIAAVPTSVGYAHRDCIWWSQHQVLELHSINTIEIGKREEPCHIVAIFYYASTASIVKPCGILIIAFGTDYVTPMKSARHIYLVYMTRPNS
eukprot:scaffold2123_cov63-Attheya_sp.AAC.1